MGRGQRRHRVHPRPSTPGEAVYAYEPPVRTKPTLRNIGPREPGAHGVSLEHALSRPRSDRWMQRFFDTLLIKPTEK